MDCDPAGSSACLRVGSAPRINGMTFSDYTTYLDSFEVGTVNQLDVQGMNRHPFHLHVNSYQIASTPTGTHGGYFAVGDWHVDTRIKPGAPPNSCSLATASQSSLLACCRCEVAAGEAWSPLLGRRRLRVTDPDSCRLRASTLGLSLQARHATVRRQLGLCPLPGRPLYW